MGQRCFDPIELPPDIEITAEVQLLLSQADRALARLDGAGTTVPDPDLFIYAFLRQEAALSSQIEGTQASLDDLFAHEAKSAAAASDVTDIVNYIEALNWGIEQLSHLPLSLRLLRGMHERLLASGRGAQRNPGQFREGQNYAGPEGGTIEEASFVPPAVPLMHKALEEWERYLHDRSQPPLVRAAVAHAQFETIHPFWDGNGRIGRMMITLMLIQETVLERPLLYLSLFFKTYRGEYYDRLQATRDDGDWQGWLAFFLRGVRETCKAALETARDIARLRERTLLQAQSLGRSSNNMRLADALFRNPYVDAGRISELLDVTHQTGLNLIERFEKAGILQRRTARRRGSLVAFGPYLDLLSADVQFQAAAGQRKIEQTQGETT